MFAVIFEVQPKKERWNDYLNLAKQLKPKLEAISGFIDNERFENTRYKGHVLSLSTWVDEKAVIRWRTQGEHHSVQKKGRFEIFTDYHLRVGEVITDSRPPQDIVVEEKHFDETVIGQAKVCTITEVSIFLASVPTASISPELMLDALTPQTATPDAAGPPPSMASAGLRPEQLLAHLQLDPQAEGLIEHEIFESITNPGKLLVLGSWQHALLAGNWAPVPCAGAGDIRHRQVRIIRDYGMFERREAPQFYPDVEVVVDLAVKAAGRRADKSG